MTWITVNDRQKITLIVDHLTSKGKEIKIRANGDKTPFTSKFLKMNQDNPSSEMGNGAKLIIEKLSPEKGNALIQTLPKVTAEFLINKNLCRCNLDYMGISTHPHIGFIVGFPESMEVEEKRREDRVPLERPQFISVAFSLSKNSNGEKQYELNVLDCSKYGLGLLITEKDFDLLGLLNIGDKIENIAFFASWAMIKVNGTVCHFTKLKEGDHKGCYLLGIDSPDIIESCKPPEAQLQ